MIAISLVGATAPAVGADMIDELREQSAAIMSLRFAEPARCQSGPRAGALCGASSDCGPGVPCRASAAVPSEVTCRLDHVPQSPPFQPVALWGPETFVPEGDTLTITIPAHAIRIMREGSATETHRLTICWVSAGERHCDDRTVRVRNLPIVRPTP